MMSPCFWQGLFFGQFIFCLNSPHKTDTIFMKKLLLGVGVLASVFSFGQRFGLKAGVNVASNSVSEKEFYHIPYYMADAAKPTLEKNTLTGFHIGAFYNVSLGNKWAFQPELIYTNYGMRLNINYQGIVIQTKVETDYLALPLMVQYYPVPSFQLEAGPELGILVNSKISGSGQSLDIRDQTKKVNAGIGIGAGYYFTDHIGLNMRYVSGLTDLDDSGVKAKNIVFQIGLACRF